MWPTELPDEKPLWKVPVKTYEQGYKDGAEEMKRECVEKLKQAWVNTNGKFDINKAVDVIESLPVK